MTPQESEMAPAANRDHLQTTSNHIESDAQFTSGSDPWADVPHPADLDAVDDEPEISFRERQIRDEVRKLEVREEARQRVASANNAHMLDAITRPIRLDEFLAIPDEPAQYRINELFPVGGRIMLSAQYKAGKTTAVGNLIRSLVDGDPLFGKFTVDPVHEVVLLDTELDDRMLRSWLRDQGITNQEKVRLKSLRGRVGTFNILDPEIRAVWADRLRGADLLILDVLRPVLDALGLDENRDAGRFLVAFDALLTEAGIPEGAISHHMGHNGERSRGDSRLQDWPDAIWKIVRSKQDDPSSPRFFSAYGRDVDIPEGALTYDVRTRSITYGGVGTSRKASAQAAALPDLLDYIELHPGASGSEIEGALVGSGASQHPQKAVREALKAGIDGNDITWRPGPRGSHLHFTTRASRLDQDGFVKESAA